MVHTPVRTCVGCRRAEPATELLRVVLAPDATPPGVVPDPRRRAGGRGAWVHPVLACVDAAERRRAFGRALHASGFVDPARVRSYVTDPSQLDQLCTTRSAAHDQSVVQPSGETQCDE